MKISPIQLVIMGFFGLLAVLALGVLTGIVPLPKSSTSDIAGRVVVWGTLPKDGFVFVENALKVKRKNISFSYEQKSKENFEEVLSEAIASGRGPDLIILSQEQLLRNKAKIVSQPASQDVLLNYQNTYVNGADVFVNSEGIIAYPLGLESLVMFYNDRLLTSAGFAKPPEQWSQFAEYSSALTKVSDNKDITTSLVALGTFDNIEYPLDIMSTLILQTGNKVVDKETKYDGSNKAYTTYSSRVANEQTNQVITFYNAFSNPTKKLYSWNQSLPRDIDAFTTESSALWFGYLNDEKRLKAKNPNLQYKITAVPQLDAIKDKLTYGRVYAVAALRSSRNLPAARAVQGDLAQGDIQKIIVEESKLFYPYRVTPNDSIKTTTDALAARIAVQTIGYPMPSYSFMYTLMKNVTNQVASGLIDVQKGSALLQAEINNYITKNKL